MKRKRDELSQFFDLEADVDDSDKEEDEDDEQDGDDGILVIFLSSR